MTKRKFELQYNCNISDRAEEDKHEEKRKVEGRGCTELSLCFLSSDANASCHPSRIIYIILVILGFSSGLCSAWSHGGASNFNHCRGIALSSKERLLLKRNKCSTIEHRAITYRHDNKVALKTRAHAEKQLVPNNDRTLNKKQLRGLYPPVPMLSNGRLLVHDSQDGIDHVLYYEIYGRGSNPALFIHGGLRSGCFPRHAQFFDPNHYMIVLLDQRGCGKSEPKGSMRDNDTSALVSDIEALRKNLNVEQWKVILGGAWGSALALAYAQVNPYRVASIILRSVSLLRHQEMDWFFSPTGGAADLIPTEWKRFSNPVMPASSYLCKYGEDGSRGVLHEYCNWLACGSPEHKSYAFQSWLHWEYALSKHRSTDDNNRDDVLVWDGLAWKIQDYMGMTSAPAVFVDVREQANRLRKFPKNNDDSMNVDPSHLPFYYYTPEDPKTVVPTNNMLTLESQGMFGDEYTPPNIMFSFLHSARNGFFGGRLLDHDRMRYILNIPCIAIHGGQDHISPVDNALDLLEVLPTMELRIPMNATHSMYDPEILNEIVQATDRLRMI